MYKWISPLALCMFTLNQIGATRSFLDEMMAEDTSYEADNKKKIKVVERLLATRNLPISPSSKRRSNALLVIQDILDSDPKAGEDLLSQLAQSKGLILYPYMLNDTRYYYLAKTPLTPAQLEEATDLRGIVLTTGIKACPDCQKELFFSLSEEKAENL